MTRYGMLIDVAKCNACYNCVSACKDEFWGNDYPPYSRAQPKFGQNWVRVDRRERGHFPYITVAYMPVMCQMCRDPPCLKAARDGAVYVREDGIVMIDPEKSRGQRQIVDACPYGVIYWNEELQIPQKCTFCAHLLDQGRKQPRCVDACPTGAMVFGDLDDPDSELSRMIRSLSSGQPYRGEETKVLYSGKPEAYEPKPGVGPSVLYLNLHRMTKLFIAGSVVLRESDDLVEGASVRLEAGGREIAATTTDAFGQFHFDGLEPGKYTVRVEYPGHRQLSVDVEARESTYLGYLFLEKRGAPATQQRLIQQPVEIRRDVAGLHSDNL
ncbi:MAG: 4Fe-4S dicluster domain-containing protein [Nitrososphaeria archaeon]|jgi:Fe-S-cluster-containing dehydrogenase component